MPSPANTVVGIVTSAGKMQRAVRIRVARQVYNSYLQKVSNNCYAYRDVLTWSS